MAAEAFEGVCTDLPPVRAAMTQDELKQAGRARGDAPRRRRTPWIGVGSGSTANCFIDALAARKHRVAARSRARRTTAARLKSHGIRVVDLNDVDDLPVYVDGADEIDRARRDDQGRRRRAHAREDRRRGGAQFVCIADASKLRRRLGRSRCRSR